MTTLNEVYSSLSSKRRYEVWFLRLGLEDGSGAWWLRYLLMNPARGGCANDPRGMPVQVWATWFPREGNPQSFIQGFSLKELDLSARGENPFRFGIEDCSIGQDGCHGKLDVERRKISWDLKYRSTFRVTLSDKGWIGFSRTPHSDAVFSGHITLDGQKFAGDPLGFGVQGHNCAYRHRHFWTWAHVYFSEAGMAPTTLEVLIYEMPLRMIFRKAVLWHEGISREFRNVQETRRDRNNLEWNFRCSAKDGVQMDAMIKGAALNIHHVPYVKTNCAGTFEVANNSLAGAVLRLERPGRPLRTLKTDTGAVLEMVGL